MDSIQRSHSDTGNNICESCSTTGGCPFAYNDYSEQIQNYGFSNADHLFRDWRKMKC